MNIHTMTRRRSIKASRSWSDLCIEILCLVARFLSYRDFVRFGVVCKSWRRVILDGIQGRPTNYMPMYMHYAWFKFKNKEKVVSIMELFDLSTKQAYSIGKIVSKEARELLVKAEVCASRNGWLLFAKKVTRIKGPFVFFFYSPFYNEIIQLPPLEHLNKFRIYENVATFTAHPTSRDDCSVYVLVKTSKQEFTYILSKCDLKNRTWSVLFTSTLPQRAHELAYIDGILFHGFEQSTFVGAFDVQRQEWETIDVSNLIETTSCQVHDFHAPVQLFLVEGDCYGDGDGDGKKLFLLYSATDHGSHALPFDRLNKKWIEAEESYQNVLGNRKVFLKCPSSIAIVPPWPVGHQARHQFRTTILNSYDIYTACQRFRSPCEPEWDIVLEYASKKEFLKSTFVQVPKLGYLGSSSGRNRSSADI